MSDKAKHDLTVTFLQAVHGLPPSGAEAVARMIRAANGLFPVAIVAGARETETKYTVWNRLTTAEHDIDGDEMGLPDLFSGARGQALINGLLSFCWAYGGKRLYIPHAITEGHPFHTAAGPAAASHIASTFGGLPLIVPAVDSLARIVRDQLLREDYRNGATLNELVERYSLAYPIVCTMTRPVRLERQRVNALNKKDGGQWQDQERPSRKKNGTR